MRRGEAYEPDAVTELMTTGKSDCLVLVHVKGVGWVVVALEKRDLQERLGKLINASL